MIELFKIDKDNFLSCIKFVGIFCIIGIFMEDIFRYTCSINMGYFVSLFILFLIGKWKKLNIRNKLDLPVFICKLINTFCTLISIVDIFYVYLLVKFKHYADINMILHYQWKQIFIGVILATFIFYIFFLRNINISYIKKYISSKLNNKNTNTNVNTNNTNTNININTNINNTNSNVNTNVNTNTNVNNTNTNVRSSRHIKL